MTETVDLAESLKMTRDSKLQNILNSAAEANDVVGAQVSIIWDRERADLIYGKANRELDVDMTRDTLVQIGSVTKVFNAALVMSMVEEDLLNLDEPIHNYIPEI